MKMDPKLVSSEKTAIQKRTTSMGISTILSFLTVPVVAALVKGDANPELPTFKPRFWFRGDRLDARPVAWSLRNHPEEWVWQSEGYTIRHEPSQHVFWVSIGPYHLYEANCSCNSNSGKFQKFQQLTFGLAFRAWRRNQLPQINAEQFASHFVRSGSGE